MTVGQTQVLEYTVRNNLNKQTLPLNISIVNDGDSQSSSLTSESTTCGATLAPHASCDITVTISSPQSGQVKRHLNIAYNGRAPLIGTINLNVTQASYTVLIYMVGSDLESGSGAFATTNINQMKEIGSTSNMNIIIETGGANKTGWMTVKRQIVLKDSTLELQDLGAVDMSLASTIEDFLSWGMTNYPADKYIAVFWDHGGGPNGGYGGDEIFSGNSTSINNLSSAVKSATQATGKKFEIIGFDTCLLGNIETFSGLYPYTNYMVGSEDLEPGAGWEYNTFLNYVTSNPTANGLSVGTQIVDGYTEQNSDSGGTTLSVIASAQFPALITALNQFTNTLSPYISSVANWKNLARGRLEAPDYVTSPWDNKSTDVADVYGLAEGMAEIFTADTSLQSAASALKTANQNAVKYYKNSVDRASSRGLTIYYPSILAEYKTGYPNVTKIGGTSFFSTDYTDFITDYVDYYTTNSASLIATPSSLAFNGTAYTATVSNDYENLFAAVGSDTCDIFLAPPKKTLASLPCVVSFQSSGITSTSGGGNTWNISFNKADRLSSWPLINGEPALLIDLDASSVVDKRSFLIPVQKSSGSAGFLVVIKDDANNYNVEGFLPVANNSDGASSKIEDIEDGTVFNLREYALNGTWQLLTSTETVTAPFTITFGAVPGNFDKFRYLVADLTGALNITSTSVAY